MLDPTTDTGTYESFKVGVVKQKSLYSLEFGHNLKHKGNELILHLKG